MYKSVFEGRNGLTKLSFFAALCVTLTLFLSWNVTRDVSEGLKILLAVGALCLVLVWPTLSGRLSHLLLSILVFVSAANYMRWGPELLTERIDSYDVIHYYLGAKYFHELGYYDLYPAIAVVDYEAGPFSAKANTYRAQGTESGYMLRPMSEAIEAGRKIRESRFSADRWQSFANDFLYIQRKFTLTKGLWADLLKDRGFNATPAWIALFSPIANLVPARYIKWLCAADILLLGIGLLFARWAYGNITALWGLVFVFVSYSFRWPVVGWSFFRYDWICALLIALALIKKRHHFWAGVATGLASSFRLFPVLWMFGPASKGAIRLAHFSTFSFRRNSGLLLLAAGFLITIASMGLVVLAGPGPDAIAVHAENMAEHTSPEELSSRRLGFVIGMAYDGKLLPKYLPEISKNTIDNMKYTHLTVAAIYLLILAWYMRNCPDDDFFAYGFIPFFMLLTASYYYAAGRIILIVLHAANIDRPRHRVGLGILMTLELFSNWAETAFPNHRVFLIGYLSWGLTAYAVFIAWSLYREGLEEEPQREPVVSPQTRPGN